MLRMICYLPATCLRTHTHTHTKMAFNSTNCWVPFKGWRLRVGVGSSKVHLQYGSVHLKAFTTPAKFFVSPHSQLVIWTAGCTKANWHYIVRTDINPWYFHCSLLESPFPSLLPGNSHRARGQTNRGEILRYSDNNRKKRNINCSSD